MNSDLQHLRDELEPLLNQVPTVNLSLGPEGKWCPAQIFEHLWLTYHNTSRGLIRCLESGQTLATRPTMQHALRRLVVVGMRFLPGGAKSPERARPKGAPTEETLSTILSELDRMDAYLADCAARFGSSTRILDHPRLGPLTVRQWCVFHRVHGHHHAKQIRERLQTAK